MFSYEGKPYRYEQPETWPKDFKPKYIQGKLSLKETGRILKVLTEGGLDGLRKWYSGPTKYTPEQYLEVWLAAARRCVDEDLEVPLLYLGWSRLYPRDIGLYNPAKGKSARCGLTIPLFDSRKSSRLGWPVRDTSYLCRKRSVSAEIHKP